MGAPKLGCLCKMSFAHAYVRECLDRQFRRPLAASLAHETPEPNNARPSTTQLRRVWVELTRCVIELLGPYRRLLCAASFSQLEGNLVELARGGRRGGQ